MKFSILLFLVLIGSLLIQSCAAQTALAPAAYRIKDGKASTVLPFELFDNRQMIKVRINGAGPFTFGVDTGGANVITPEAAAKLGLKLHGEFETGGAGEKRVPAWRTEVKTVEAGELIAADQPFIVLSLKEIQTAIGFPEFDGLVGYELFGSLTTKIDFEKSEFVFTDPGKFEYRGKGAVVPFEFAGRIPEIEGEIDGIGGRLIVDTGDRSSLTLFVPFYEKHNFREKYPERVKALTGWGIGGGIPSEMLRLKEFRIDGVTLTDVVTRLPLVKSGVFTRSNQIGSVGSGLLRRFNVTFDYRRKRMILEKNKHFRYEDRFENYILEDYAALLEKGVDRGFPGIILGVQRENKPPRIFSAGLANIEKRTPMRPGERFPIASITKIFTAAAVLKLVDAGKLSLDAKVVDLLDKKLVGRIPHIEEVTVSRLLDHSSGIYGFNNDREYIETWLGGRVGENFVWTPEKFVALAYEDRNKPFGRPGTGHFYGDTNYVLLGLIVEKVSDKSLRRFVSEKILEPLGLNDTAYYGSTGNAEKFELPATVEGYLKRSETLDSFVTLDAGFKSAGENLVNTTAAVEKTDAAAGMVSSAADLLKFGRAFYGGKLLSKGSMKRVLRFAAGIENEPPGTNRQALMSVHRRKYGTFFASSGDGPAGINATLVFHPESETVVVVFTNIFGLFDEIDFINDEIVGQIISQKRELKYTV